MEDSAIRGATAEAKGIARLTEMGFVCSLPIVHSARYDLVVDISGNRVRVQVKHAWYDSDILRTELRGGQPKQAYESNEVDAFLIWNSQDDELYWLWFHEAPATGIKRPQSWYQSYALDSRLDGRGVFDVN